MSKKKLAVCSKCKKDDDEFLSIIPLTSRDGYISSEQLYDELRGHWGYVTWAGVPIETKKLFKWVQIVMQDANGRLSRKNPPLIK